MLLAAFNAVEDARGDIPLTYFEYGTLAVFHSFAGAGLEAAILEVGLGGRLDAVNVVAADVAVVTSIDLDHMDYLGPSREDIAREKAGIFRRAAPWSAPSPIPVRAYRTRPRPGRSRDPDRSRLRLRLRGAAVALLGTREGRASACPIPRCAARTSWQTRRRCSRSSICCAIASMSPPARSVTASSASSCRAASRCCPDGRRLCSMSRTIRTRPRAAATLGTMGYFPETLAVFGMLADKDVRGVIDAVAARIDRWFVATLPGPRGATADAIRDELARAGIAATPSARSPISGPRSPRRAKRRVKLIEFSFSDVPDGGGRAGRGEAGNRACARWLNESLTIPSSSSTR